MNKQQREFCNYFAFGVGKIVAAVLAGYDPLNASSTADALLALDEVKAQIEQDREANAAEYAAALEDVRKMLEDFDANVTP